MPENADPMSALREAVKDWVPQHPLACVRDENAECVCGTSEVYRAALEVASLAPETDRDAEVARIAAVLHDKGYAHSCHDRERAKHIRERHSEAARLYDAGLRAPSLEGARHPEAGATHTHEQIEHEHEDKRRHVHRLAASPGARHDSLDASRLADALPGDEQDLTHPESGVTLRGVIFLGTKHRMAEATLANLAPGARHDVPGVEQIINELPADAWAVEQNEALRAGYALSEAESMRRAILRAVAGSKP